MPPAGIEPAQYRYRGILSPLRLPVPPWRHDMIITDRMRAVKPEHAESAGGDGKCIPYYIWQPAAVDRLPLFF